LEPKSPRALEPAATHPIRARLVDVSQCIALAVWEALSSN
jgi:hypothetical protein